MKIQKGTKLLFPEDQEDKVFYCIKEELLEDSNNISDLLDNCGSTGYLFPGDEMVVIDIIKRYDKTWVIFDEHTDIDNPWAIEMCVLQEVMNGPQPEYEIC